MNTELDAKASFIHSRLVKLFKENGLMDKLHQITGDKDWMLSVEEVRLAIGENDNPEFIGMKQFEKLALLLGTTEQDARLIAVRAVFQKHTL